MYGYGGHSMKAVNDNLDVACPIEDSSDMLKADIEQINVHVFDGSSSGGNYSRAYVCLRDPFGVGGTCLASQGASGSGHKTLTLSSNAELGFMQSHLRAANFATLRVSMYSNSTPGQDLFGYFLSDED